MRIFSSHQGVFVTSDILITSRFSLLNDRPLTSGRLSIPMSPWVVSSLLVVSLHLGVSSHQVSPLTSVSYHTLGFPQTSVSSYLCVSPPDHPSEPAPPQPLTACGGVSGFYLWSVRCRREAIFREIGSNSGNLQQRRCAAIAL